METITTKIPSYKLYDLENSCEIDISRFIAEKSESAFKKLLGNDDLELLPGEAKGSTFVQFRLFDTPGLDDTKGNDIQNIARTFTGLSDVHEFHMVLIMDSHEVPLTMSQKAAFKSYFDLFEDLKALIVIVHTKVPNIHRHPANTKLDKRLAGRSQFFNEVMGRPVPTKRIDCDIDETGPAHLCLMRKTIREILKIATIKTPVVRRRAHIQKTLAMKSADKLVEGKYKAMLKSVHTSCDALSQVDQVEIKVQTSKDEIKIVEENIRDKDTDDLVALFEKRFDEEVGFMGWIQDLFGRANEAHTMEYSNEDHTIDKVRVDHEAIETLNESGGEGHKNWYVEFKRNAFQTGYYHAILSMTRRTKYQGDLQNLRQKLDELNKTLGEDTRKYISLSGIVQRNTDGDTSSNENKQRLMDKIVKYGMVVAHTEADELTLDVFLELANAGVYQGDTGSSADALEGFLAKKFGIDGI